MDRDHRVHYHGTYPRYRNARSNQKRLVPRWLCTVCCCTISVLADEALPYRAVEVELLERWFDSRHRGRDPPEVTEVERGCLERAERRFAQRTTSLTSTLGQMIKAIRPTAQRLWIELRKSRRLVEILGWLAEKFKTSLLGDYRCLKPFSATGPAGATGSRIDRFRGSRPSHTTV